MVDAINHKMEDETVELNVGSIILSPGFEPFDPSKFDNYDYAKGSKPGDSIMDPTFSSTVSSSIL